MYGFIGKGHFRVPLSLFWSRSNASNIHQNLEGTNFPEKASDSCDNISGRHVTHVTDTRSRRVINEQRYNNFSSESIGICNQFEKVYTSASPTNRIFRLGDSVEMNLFLPQRKVEEIVQMSENAMEGSLTLRDLTRLMGKLTSTIQPILPAKLQISFLQQIQIQALRKNMTYKPVPVITLDQQAKEELSWWIANMQIYNGKSLLIVPPEPYFQMHPRRIGVLRVKGLPWGVDGLHWRKLGT